MKKFLSVLVAVLVLVTAVISVMATDVSVQSVDERTRQQFLMESEKQREAVAAHEVLYNSFLVEGSVEENFPDNYGGDYIKDGILHINIVDLPAQDITYYITNLVKVDLKSGMAIQGDSGGPIFTATGSFGGVLSGLDQTGTIMINGEQKAYSDTEYYFSPTQYLSTSSFSCAVG